MDKTNLSPTAMLVRRAMNRTGVKAPALLLTWLDAGGKVEETPDVKTAEVTTDMVLRCNPDYFKTLTLDQAAFAACNAILRVILGHHYRRGDREEGDWNKATDMVVDEALIASEIGEPVEGALRVPEDYKGPMTVEGVYSHIYVQKPPPPPPKNSPNPSQAPGQGQGGQGGAGQGPQNRNPFASPKPPPPPPGSIAQGSKVVAGQAAQAQPGTAKNAQVQALAKFRSISNQIGTGVESIDAMIDLIPEEREDWRNLLKRGMSQALASKGHAAPSYRRMARRQIPDVILPGHVDATATVAIIIDASGSMGDTVKPIAEEVIAIVKRNPDVKVWLAVHTGHCVWSGWITPGSVTKDVAEATAFTGGTAVIDTYQKMKSEIRRVDTCIHFTDGHVWDWPEWAPARRWVIAGIGAHWDEEYPNGLPELAKIKLVKGFGRNDS